MRSVIAVVDDLFFAAKIRAAAENLGVNVRFERSAEAAIEAAQANRPELFVVDLHAGRCDPFALVEQLKAVEGLREVPVVGFFSHVQTELQQRAVGAGFDRVLPRSAFTKKLPEILQGNI